MLPPFKNAVVDRTGRGHEALLDAGVGDVEKTGDFSVRKHVSHSLGSALGKLLGFVDNVLHAAAAHIAPD